MKRILTSCAIGIDPNLFEHLKDYEVILTDANPLIRQVYPKIRSFIIPYATHNSFERNMKRILKDYSIDYYIPYNDNECLKAFDIVKDFPETTLISPRKEFVEICLNKYDLMRTLEGLGISIILTMRVSEVYGAWDYPVFLKLNKSTGSRGAQIIRNEDEFQGYFLLNGYEPEEILIQEYLDGTEYTCSVVVNSRNKIMAIVPKRNVRKNGLTIKATIVKHEEIERVCRDIVELMNPCGQFNVQIMEVDKELYVFEINPRFSSTSFFTCSGGVNEWKLCIENWENEDPPYIDDYNVGLNMYRRSIAYFY